MPKPEKPNNTNSPEALAIQSLLRSKGLKETRKALLAEIRAVVEEHHTQTAIAKALGVARRSWHRWLKDHRELQIMVDKAKEKRRKKRIAISKAQREEAFLP